MKEFQKRKDEREEKTEITPKETVKLIYDYFDANDSKIPPYNYVTENGIRIGRRANYILEIFGKTNKYTKSLNKDEYKLLLEEFQRRYQNRSKK